jgi:hypothetical protein
MDTKELVKDGGYRSRKLWVTVFAMLVVLVAGYLSPAATLPEVVAGIVSLCGIYVTGNTVGKWNARKAISQVTTPDLQNSDKEGGANAAD